MDEPTDNISIFISHRHVDKILADVFREEIESWGDNIEIYQSSSPEDGTQQGEDRNASIKAQMRNSNLVLSVCSLAPGNLDWCMYECGLAAGSTETLTKIVPFSTSDEIPEPLDEKLSMQLTLGSITQFVHGFHVVEGFIPGRPPYDPDISASDKKTRARRLYDRLLQCAPRPVESVPVYDRIIFRISFDSFDQAMTTMKNAKREERFEVAAPVIFENSYVLDTSGDPQEHFGFDVVTDNLSMFDLVERWKNINLIDETGWAYELSEAVIRALNNYPEGTISVPFESLASGGGGWILPLMARYQKVPLKNRYEFDVLFCRLGTEAAKRMLQPGNGVDHTP